MRRISLLDLHGHLRSKYVGTELDWTTFCGTVLLHDITGRSVAVPGFGQAVGNVNLIALPSGPVRPTGSSSVQLTRLQLLDGRAHPLCLRSTLQANATGLDGLGWQLQVGIELEFVLHDPEDAANPDIEHDLYGEIDPRSRVGLALAGIVDHGTRAGVRVGSVAREYERSQFEVTSLPRTALAAADDALILRQIVKEVPLELGLRADLSPQPDPTGLGSGLHINLSLVEVDGGRPWTAATAERFGRWLAARIPAWILVFVPSPLGYARLRNRQFARASPFGVERRDTLVRLATDGSVPRLEIRVPDPQCNVHLALCVVAALTRTWLLSSEDDIAHPAAPLASSLRSAVDLSSGWEAGVTELVGRDLVEVFRAIKASELRLEVLAPDAVNALYDP